MATDTLFIQFEEVSQLAGDIDKLNVSLRELLDDMKKAVVNLENSWESEGSTGIRNKMSAMDTRFEEYEKVVTEYTKFLRQVVTTYQEVEAKITKSANLFE